VASLAALGWSQLRPVPVAPVMRFESPSRPGQEPATLGGGSFGLSPDGSFLVYLRLSPDERLDQLWIRRWDDPEATPIRGTEVRRR